jgi:hypothetical protein
MGRAKAPLPLGEGGPQGRVRAIATVSLDDTTALTPACSCYVASYFAE